MQDFTNSGSGGIANPAIDFNAYLLEYNNTYKMLAQGLLDAQKTLEEKFQQDFNDNRTKGILSYKLVPSEEIKEPFELVVSKYRRFYPETSENDLKGHNFLTSHLVGIPLEQFRVLYEDLSDLLKGYYMDSEVFHRNVTSKKDLISIVIRYKISLSTQKSPYESLFLGVSSSWTDGKNDYKVRYSLVEHGSSVEPELVISPSTQKSPYSWKYGKKDYKVKYTLVEHGSSVEPELVEWKDPEKFNTYRLNKSLSLFDLTAQSASNIPIGYNRLALMDAVLTYLVGQIKEFEKRGVDGMERLKQLTSPEKLIQKELF